jgi:hypothetical protein
MTVVDLHGQLKFWIVQYRIRDPVQRYTTL